MLLPSLTGWRSQYDRMLRSYARLSEPRASSVDSDDDLQHFFQDCWHLKDWLIQDRSTKFTRKMLNEEIKSHLALQITADLANACKHLERTPEHKEWTGAYVTSKSVTAHLGQSRGVDVVYVVTLKDGRALSARDVAKKACEEWDTILRTHQLI